MIIAFLLTFLVAALLLMFAFGFYSERLLKVSLVFWILGAILMLLARLIG